MSEDKNKSSIIYYPFCKECNGFLNITIQPLNFSIEYECENNKNHKKSNIYFKNFERFYLKEKELIKCFKCHINLENSQFYNCEKCKNIYCGKCLLEDIKEPSHKHILNEKYHNRCLIHNNDFTEYCFNCKTNICIFCIKNGKHNNHNTQSFLNIMPSLINIENLKKKIKEKYHFTNDLIERINNWQQVINRKAEELKQNLKDEISLLEKILFNFNNNFRNYSYFQNFNYIEKTIKNTSNNQYLEEFSNISNFEKQTETIMKIFKYMGKKIDSLPLNNLSNEIKFNQINSKLILKINEQYFIDYDFNKTLNLFYYDNNNKNISLRGNLPLQFEIYSLSYSQIENQIFACLLNSLKIKIINLNIEKGQLSLNDSEINYNNNYNALMINYYNSNHFYKCIQYSNKILIASDNINIIIWEKNNNFNYIIKKTIPLNSITYDILKIDNYHFITAQSDAKTLTIFEINNFNEIKKIKNINCKKNSNCLIKANDNYIIINCDKGIGVFYIKTKEFIEYIEDLYPSIIDKKFCYNEGYIYLIYFEQNNLRNNILFGQNIEGNNSLFNNLDNKLDNNCNQKKNYNNNNNIFSVSLNNYNNNKGMNIINNNNYNYKIKIIIGKIFEGSFHIIKNDYNILFNNKIIEFFCLTKNLILLLGNYDMIFVYEKI